MDSACGPCIVTEGAKVTSRASAQTSSERLYIGGARLQVEASLSDGTLAFSERSTGWRPLPQVFATAQPKDGRVISTRSRPWALRTGPARFKDLHGQGVRAVLSAPPADGLALHLELSLYDEQPFALLRLGLENRSRELQRVERLTPLTAAGDGGVHLALPVRPGRWRFFRHGWQSWAPSLSLSAHQQDIDVRPPTLAPAPAPRGRGRFASDEVAALFDPASGSSLVLGFVSAQRQWAQVRLAAGRGELEAVAFADDCPLPPDTTLWSEELMLELTDDTTAALNRYGEALSRRMGARVPRASPSGWCSWYYYFWDVTEEEVLRNLRFLEQHREALPLDYVQIDDGYQANIGDWTRANEKFPHGMAWLARAIRSSGFQPGLWLAPLLIGATSDLYAQHPDWVVRDGANEPAVAARNWNQVCYGLDATNPEAEAWLKDLFRQVTDEWGYELVKVDFLYGGAVAGRRHDRDASRIEAYRRALSAIRTGAGERYVLGCGALMGPSVGLVDGQRIGPDVAPWWRFRRPAVPPRSRGRPPIGGEPSVENALRNVLTRSWMHGRLWANDPDCLLARRDRTKLTLPEVQSLATAVALSGGMVVVSDDLTQLSPERLDLISLLLPPLGEAATARDLMTESMPCVFELGVTRSFESWRLLAQFNWVRRRRSLLTTLPPGRWHVFELWDGRYHGEQEGELALPDVPARGVRLLSLRAPQSQPQVLATTFHFSMGGRELADVRFDARRRLLHVDLQPVARKQGDLFVLVPDEYRFTEASLNGEFLRPQRQEAGLLVFRFSLEAVSRLAVQFVSSG